MSEIPENSRFIYPDELIKRWKIRFFDLVETYWKLIPKQYIFQHKEIDPLIALSPRFEQIKQLYYIDIRGVLEVEEACPHLRPDDDGGTTLTGDTEPLSGADSRDLGRLRQERGKWKNAIKAAVDIAQKIKEKITRNELKDKVYKYDLPDTTIEILWQALREKGLTEGAGRPKNIK